MLKIMILEDEETCLKKEKAIVQRYFAENGFSCQIDVCQDPSWFMSGLEHSKYDIYILDIVLPDANGLDGLKIAKKIREFYCFSIIIFITNYMNYALEAYQVSAWKYLSKENLECDLPKAFDNLLPILRYKDQMYYTIVKKNSIERIAYYDILYFQKDGKYVMFIHKDGESRIRKSLKTVLEELDNPSFVMIDKGTVVNAYHIRRLEGSQLLLSNNIRLNACESNLPNIRQMIIKAWGGF